jgi:hypothetical protein
MKAILNPEGRFVSLSSLQETIYNEEVEKIMNVNKTKFIDDYNRLLSQAVADGLYAIGIRDIKEAAEKTECRVNERMMKREYWYAGIKVAWFEVKSGKYWFYNLTKNDFDTGAYDGSDTRNTRLPEKGNTEPATEIDGKDGTQEGSTVDGPAGQEVS